MSCGRRVLKPWLVIVLGCLSCGGLFGIDFSGPLQGVQVSVSGSVISYQVFDPGRGFFATGSTNTPATYISNPSANGGVVAWLAGTIVHCRIYDPGRSNWMGASFPIVGASYINDPVSDSGIVSWLAGGKVYFTVYDPFSGTWKQNVIDNSASSFISNPKNSGGVIAWSADSAVWYVTYNPFTRDNLTTRGWVYGASGASFTGDIQVGGGVVAWQTGTSVGFAHYDLTRTNWVLGGWGGTFITSLAIANSTVSWVDGTPGTSYIAGYSYTTGSWTVGSSTPTHAGFLVSPTSGNAPLFVWFVDLSLGGANWAWNFGDGNSANSRIPYHVFTGLGRYTVLQTVSGFMTPSTAATNILTDISAPNGAFTINNDDPYTHSLDVTLNINISDNSGAITAMRFSNTNNVNWSAWIPYATNYPWTLSAGPDGIRSVYGQFMDPSSNISFTISDSITLDTRPPPLVYTTNYFVNENAQTIEVSVLLSYASHFDVYVDFATADGTATAGLDYASTNGHLHFNPFLKQTNLTFTLSISNDTVVELNETVLINLSNPTNATLGPPGTVTILDDDAPFVSFATNLFTVDEYANQALITATLSSPSGRTLSVNYASSNGTATAGSDYSAVSGTLIFSPGQTSRSFAVPISNDTIDEPDETVRLYLSNPTNALLGAQASANLLIIDDDPPPAGFSTNNFYAGGAAGVATISVRLNTPFSQTVLVGYTTSDGTAQGGIDYVAASGTLVFGAGETNKSFFVNILSNPSRPLSQTVRLGLTSFNNAIPGLVTNATLTLMSPSLGASRWQTNAFHSTLSAMPGGIYAIDISSNLTQWSELLRVTNASSAMEFTDPTASGNRRFYRARQAN